jgi:hypothetical protein
VICFEKVEGKGGSRRDMLIWGRPIIIVKDFFLPLDNKKIKYLYLIVKI